MMCKVPLKCSSTVVIPTATGFSDLTDPPSALASSHRGNSTQLSKQLVKSLLRIQRDIETIESTLHLLVDRLVGVRASLAFGGAKGSVASISVLAFPEMQTFAVVGGGSDCPVCARLAKSL
jgi:hypothetical protein